MFTIHFDKPFKKMCLFLHKHIMQQLASHSFKVQVSQVFLFHKGSTCFKSCSTVKSSKSTRTYKTRANNKRERISLNKGSRSIHEEITTLQTELERLGTLVVSLVASQNQL